MIIDHIRAVTPLQYDTFFPTKTTVFGLTAFNALNARKVDSVRYLTGFAGEHATMGLICGEKDGALKAPFSAPMAEVSCRDDVSLETVASFFDCLKTYLEGKPLSITLPPAFIRPAVMPKIIGCAVNRATSVTANFNYHYQLQKLSDWEGNMSHKARTAYHKSLKAGFKFIPNADLARAYSVIEAHHKAKGYPVAMALQDIIDTSAIIPIDSFVLAKDGIDVAARIAYRIAPGIAQGIYIGDAPGHSGLRPMNSLQHHTFQYYSQLGFSIVNVGPASTGGIPNFGLCAFKESLGCDTSLLFTVTL